MQAHGRRLFSAAIGSIASIGLLAAVASADDIDDAVKTARSAIGAVEQNEYEQIFGERQAKLGQLPFLDQAFGVARALAKEAGWTAPTKRYTFKPSTASGPVFWSTWASGRKAEAQPGVVIVVTRYTHSEGTTKVGDLDVANSDALALVKALSQAWAAGLDKPAPAAEGAPADSAAKEAEADRLACVDAAKKKTGVATVFAAAQGRLTAAKKRERREWYAWTGSDAEWIDNGGPATWVACARYDESVLAKSNPALTKGAYFISRVHAYKGVSAK